VEANWKETVQKEWRDFFSSMQVAILVPIKPQTPVWVEERTHKVSVWTVLYASPAGACEVNRTNNVLEMETKRIESNRLGQSHGVIFYEQSPGLLVIISFLPKTKSTLCDGNTSAGDLEADRYKIGPIRGSPLR
jgi:hypothetical protein